MFSIKHHLFLNVTSLLRSSADNSYSWLVLEEMHIWPHAGVFYIQSFCSVV